MQIEKILNNNVVQALDNGQGTGLSKEGRRLC